MKKLLLTAACLCMSAAATFAQMPDASKWKAGDEITDQIGWGNLSFEDPEGSDGSMNYWKLESSKGSFTKSGGLFEVYDGADVNLYQYVQLPAGIYKMECQAYYRCGNSWADDPAAFGTADWEDNALLYAQNGAYDITSEAFTAGRTFKTPLMPRLFDYQDVQLYVDEVKEGWDMSDGEYGDKGWGPCSVPGSLVWFAAGKYQPYDDGDGTKYNTVTFFLTEPGYARIGVSKIDPKGADSFMATNFKMYYLGEADEAVELMAMQDEVAEYLHKLEDLKRQVENTYGGMISQLVGDACIDLDGEIGNVENLNKEACEQALVTVKSVYDQATAAVATIASLKSVIVGMEVLYNTTDFPGKEAYGKALESAQNCLDPDYELVAEDSFENIQTIYTNLLAARVTYLTSQTPDNGAYNFSALLTTPFFCDTEYTPVWNAEAEAYQFPAIEGVEEELQPENTWATIQETGYGDLVNPENDNYKEGWIPICGNVTISEKEVENQWVIKSATWHGGGAIGITMQHSYPAIGGWTAEPTGNPELLYQIVTGLPNGYYAMSALMCNAGAEVSPLQYAYIEAGDMKETAQLTKKGNPWWGGNREAWRSGVWEKLTTNMVYVADGKVTIGTASDAFYAATGFQLYYYGENPDFTQLMAPVMAAAKEKVETLQWKGDKAVAYAILAKVPATIEGKEAYREALAVIAEVNKYVDTAYATVAAWTSLEDFGKLMGTYGEDSDESDVVATAWAYTMEIGEGETDTYLDAIASTNDYKAYVDYLSYLANVKEYTSSSAELAALVAEQIADLKSEYANAAKLEEYKAALATPYNAAVLAAAGAGNATEEKPVDVTSLIINPSFTEGSKGWEGEPAVDETAQNGEGYSKNFNVYQVIRNLPAGCYQVEVNSFYRDGEIGNAYNNWVYGATEDMEWWDNHNVTFYAESNGAVCSDYVASIACVQFTEPSFTSYISGWRETGEADENGDIVYEPIYTEINYEEVKHPFDSQVLDADDSYWFPNSQLGASYVFQKTDKYKSTVRIMVEEGQDLTIGVRKSVTINADWCVFDDFKLFYLGKEKPVAINDVNAAANAKAEYYSLSGVKLNGAQKGVNIVKMSNGTVKKVLVK